MKIPREFDPTELRVLGALLEKEQATPEYYPLTLNALVAACNQRSNREPVMRLDRSEVVSALQRLHDDVLVWSSRGARSERWRHSLDRRWELEAPTKAIMTLLLLRGPQTPGELRGRSERLHHFASPAEVEHALHQLADDPDPLVIQLQRQPGQKEARWAHLLAGTPVPAQQPEQPSSIPARGQHRVEELELRVSRLETIVAKLTAALGVIEDEMPE